MIIIPCLGVDHMVCLGMDHMVCLGVDLMECLGVNHMVCLGVDHMVCLGVDHMVCLGVDHMVCSTCKCDVIIVNVNVLRMSAKSFNTTRHSNTFVLAVLHTEREHYNYIITSTRPLTGLCQYYRFSMTWPAKRLHWAVNQWVHQPHLVQSSTRSMVPTNDVNSAVKVPTATRIASLSWRTQHVLSSFFPVFAAYPWCHHLPYWPPSSQHFTSHIISRSMDE